MRLLDRLTAKKEESAMDKALAESAKATSALRDVIRKFNESCTHDKHTETEVPRYAAQGRR